MERTQILDLMGTLKLYGMRSAYDEVMAAGIKRQHEPPRIVGDLLQSEIAEKQARSIRYQMTIAKLPLAKDVEAKTIARGTPGFSGADLANLVNEAALLAARRGKRSVGMREFEDAKDKVMMGPERKSMVMTQKEKEATAVHEAGHAIVNILVPGNDPLHKVTIIPRGRALGVTWSLPEADRLSYTKNWAEAKIAMAFGGRVAEQLVYGEDHLNTGASSDITQATSIARSMVTEWGMSEVLGPLRYSANEQEVFLGHSVTQRQNVSGETAKLIDQEIRRIVTDGEKKARQVLTDNRHLLDQLAAALMEYETQSGDEVNDLFKGKRFLITGGGTGLGRMMLEKFVELTATNPAKAYGLHPRKGTIAVGSDADLVIWDERDLVIRNADLHHAVDYTPYEGLAVTGWPVPMERPSRPWPISHR